MIQRWLRERWVAGGEPGAAAPDDGAREARSAAVEVGPIPPRPAEQWFSPAALQRAWLAVKRAGGGAGTDGMTLARFEAQLATELTSLRTELVNGVYQPRPLMPIFKTKRGQGVRQLTLWALRDRVAQRVVYDILAPSFDTLFLPCSVGFRPGRGVEDAIQLLLAQRDQGRRWVVHADIQDCFDRIEPRRLYGLVQRRVQDRLLLLYVERWLGARLLTSVDGKPRAAGTSQGAVLSPLFANIYLHEFDERISGQGLALVRYADDFVICCRRKGEAAAARVAADKALAALGLCTNPAKTRVVHLDQGLAWLGYFVIRGECFRL